MSTLIEIIFIIIVIIILVSNFLIRIIKNNLVNININSLSGFEIARTVTNKISSLDIHIIKKNGAFLSHYNYDRNVIKLTPLVFDGTNIYAQLIAFNIALNVKNNNSFKEKILNFLVILTYIILIIGALLNNSNLIYFSFIIFIITFILASLIFYSLSDYRNNITDNLKYLDTKELNSEFKKNINLLYLINIATLPYRFINYFR